MSDAPHLPVLLQPVLEALAPRDGAIFLDGTFGAGGYSRALLDAAGCHVIGVDRDPSAQAAADALSAAYPGRFTFVADRFSNLADIAAAHARAPLDGIVLDVGVSSMQLDQAARGFSFAKDGPLDMRMAGSGFTAEDIVNRAPETLIADILFRFGEERASRRIARAIVARRSEALFETTLDLADVIAACLPRPKRHAGQGRTPIHSATRSFQALRIAVNDELGELSRALNAAQGLLAPRGVLAVVSFHSLEDRMVKRFLARRSGRSGGGSRHEPAHAPVDPVFDVPVPRGVVADADEIAQNPRARSARLRFGVRTSAAPLALSKDEGVPGPSHTEILDAVSSGMAHGARS